MTIQETIRERVRTAINRLLDMDLPEIPVEVPPRTELGDLAFPVAFELAKRLKAATGQKQNPREIATRLAEELRSSEGVARVDVAGAGYLNVYLDRAEYLINAVRQPQPIARHSGETIGGAVSGNAGERVGNKVSREISGEAGANTGGKIIVEHTSVNPNKAAHVGHLRNAVLGDTTVRMLRAAGETVEVQNYIDNTGVQVADVVVGFKYIENKKLDQVKSMEFGGDRVERGIRGDASESDGIKKDNFDYYCWDLYARVGQFYEEDESRLKLRTDTLHELEAGEGETYQMADYISLRVLRCHLETMLRVGIKYDVLPRESDVLHLHIWEKAFNILKERKAIEFETEGKLAGCWVMRAGDQKDDETESEHEADKVIVRSNGTVTYTGKDIAFHLWKLGQLGLDFYYKPFYNYDDGHVAWITATESKDNDPDHPAFGNAAAYFNVIDIGQSYPQHYVKLGVMAVDHDERVERSAHLAYEKVALTPATVEQLGQELSDEDRNRAAIGMSGRKGLGVKIDDLIELLEKNALVEVATRHPDLNRADQLETAHKIAIGALRYFLLKYTRNSMISFDFKEALAFDGETGPYIQYSVVRANSIFRKLSDAGLGGSTPGIEDVDPERLAELLSGEAGDDLWSLVYLASRFDDILRGAVAALEPAIIAKWAFQMAQRFSLFYHNYHILSEPDAARRALLVAITSIVRRKLIAALEVLGIDAPERM